MKKTIKLKEHFLASPVMIYEAWLDSHQHTAMTGGEAVCSNEINGAFSAWDGYITGTNRILIKDKQIIQDWRTTEFNKEDENSELILQFSETKDGCELSLTHNNIPKGKADYQQGWLDHYFSPMKEYFNKK